MPEKRYRKTLDYLFSQLPMFQRVGKAAFKKDLTNIIKLCDHLGNPQSQFPSIHIAGTNGKGSSAHMLAAIFQAAGYRTGLYTSPHYRDFRERIKVNGKMIFKKEVIDFCEKQRSVFESIKPSFFEISVAMAFDIFAKRKVDIALIETGLGGRLDSTNIINPQLCLITNISFDHQSFLGDTLTEIAGEKAGIIKAGTPIVISERQPEVEKVFVRKAKAKNASLFFASDNIKVFTLQSDLEFSVFRVFKNDQLWLDDLKAEVFGDFQALNLAGVLQSCEIMRQKGWKITDKSIMDGLANLRSRTNYMGRWHLLSKKPLIVCDSGHNEAGWQQVIKHLEKIKFDTLHFVLGTVNDKSPEKLIRFLPKNAIYYLAKPDIPRGLEAEKLLTQMEAAGLRAIAFPSVNKALEKARENADDGDLVFVGGSSFVVAEVV